MITGKTEPDAFYEEKTVDAECELKNGQVKQIVAQTNGTSLNNNNLKAINLNSLKPDSFVVKPELGEQLAVSRESPSPHGNGPAGPSHVVHLRNIPNDASDAELLSFGSTFGSTVNCLLLKGKNQAFLEFADIESAKSMVNYFSLNQQTGDALNGKLNGGTSIPLLTIRGRQIYVQYSNYKKLQKSNDAQVNSNSLKNNKHPTGKLNEELLVSQTPVCLANPSELSVQNLLNNSAVSQLNNKSQLTINSLAANQQLTGHHHLAKTMAGANQQTAAATIRNGNSPATTTQPSSVLRVIVDNMMYLVPLETFHELFSRFGKVTKIVTFNKNGAFQALIQFESSAAAASAKAAYDGQHMFTTGNLLRIDYSKLANLSVKYNNEKSRDFTNSSLPAGPTLTSSPALGGVRNGSLAANSQLVGANSLSGLSTSHLNPQQLALAAASAAQQQQHYQHLEHVFSDPLTLGMLLVANFYLRGSSLLPKRVSLFCLRGLSFALGGTLLALNFSLWLKGHSFGHSVWRLNFTNPDPLSPRSPNIE